METKLFTFLFAFLFVLSACKNCSVTADKTNFPLNQPCMIVNYQGDNSVEGNYLSIKNIDTGYLVLSRSIQNLLPHIQDPKNWALGWGTGKPLYNNGSENLLTVLKIHNDTIFFGSIIRGGGMPLVGQQIVLWNRKPSGFESVEGSNLQSELSKLDDPAGSYMLIKVLYDSIGSRYLAFVNKVDCNEPRTYLFQSNDFVIWNPLSTRPFAVSGDHGWKGVSRSITDHYSDLITDVSYDSKKWYFAVNTFHNGKPDFKIYVNDSLTLSGSIELPVDKDYNSDNLLGYYNCKFMLSGTHMELYYNRRFYKPEDDILTQTIDIKAGKSGVSELLKIEKKGWCSSANSMGIASVIYWENEKYYVVSGAKEPNMGWFSRYLAQNQYMIKKGNVLDIELGIYQNDNEGNLIPYRWNPILTNDFGLSAENDHLGGSGFSMLEKDGYVYLFYSAKSSSENRYLPVIRKRKK